MTPVTGTIIQLARWDFLERTRRYSFLLSLVGTLFFGYLVITGRWVLRLGAYRGEYNSAWVGSLMGSASAIMLTFVGFYLVKNALARDRDSGVGQILAATRVRGLTYVVSKFLSNLAVLTSMMLVLAGAAVTMQLLSRIDGGFDLWALTAPFLFVCFPMLVLVAATAVLFESVRWLRGTVGNIVFFLLAEFAFVNNMMLHIPLLDFGGFGLFIPSMEQAARSAYPEAKLGFEMGFVGMVEGATGGAMKLFRWEGIDWSLTMVPLRLLWMGCAVGLVGVAALRFDRFDPARARTRKRSKRRQKARTAQAVVATETPAGVRDVSWSSIAPVTRRFNGMRMIAAELRLMAKGFHWSWYVAALGIVAAGLSVPLEHAIRFALPAAWIWPLAMWSGMGTRETRYNTGQLLFSSPYPLSRQLPALWLCGVMVAGAAGAGIAVRALAGGDVALVRSLAIATLFVPTLALFLGTLSGTRKLFEVIYLLLWYVGPVNGLPALDYLGAGDAAVARRAPLAYLLVTFALGVVTILRRRRASTRP